MYRTLPKHQIALDRPVFQVIREFHSKSALEPILEVSIHDEELATSRFNMMRIMARWMNAATVLA
jgi:hypothetical protein